MSDASHEVRRKLGVPTPRDPITGEPKKPVDIDLPKPVVSEEAAKLDWGTPDLITPCSRCQGTGSEEGRDICEHCYGSGEDKTRLYAMLREEDERVGVRHDMGWPITDPPDPGDWS